MRIAALTAAAVALGTVPLATGRGASVRSGSLDSTFGRGGTVRLGGACSSYGYAMAHDPADRLLVAGDEGCPGDRHYRPAVFRVTSRGSADRSFGYAGIVRVAGLTGNAHFASVAVADGGAVVAAGGTEDGGGGGALVARFTATGRLDRSFARRGVALVPASSAFTGTFTAVAALPDGRIVAGGELCAVTPPGLGATTAQAPDLRCGAALARYRRDGSLDPTFGKGGLVIGLGPRIEALAAAHDGAVITAGATGELLRDSRIAVARYRPDGSLDPRFGDGGIVRTAAARLGSEATQIVVRRDGGILVAGRGLDPDPSRETIFVMAAYRRNGQLDGSYFHRGVLAEKTSDYERETSGLALGPHDSIWVLITITTLPYPFEVNPREHSQIVAWRLSRSGRVIGGSGENPGGADEIVGAGIVLTRGGRPVGLSNPTVNSHKLLLSRWIP